MWDPPRPGLEPVSPALAGRLSTTAPPGKPRYILFFFLPERLTARLVHIFIFFCGYTWSLSNYLLYSHEVYSFVSLGLLPSNTLAASYVGLFKLVKMKWNKKFSSVPTSGKFHVLTGHMWSVAILWNSSSEQCWSRSGSENVLLVGPDSKYCRVYGPTGKTEVTV